MERTFDGMVRRFPYLARKLQFQNLDVSRAMVVACAVLHNLCIKWREEAEAVEEAAEVDSNNEDEAPEI